MSFDWFEKLLGDYLNKVILWLRDDKKRLTIGILLFVFIILSIIPKVYNLFSKFEYVKTFLIITNFIYTNSDSKNFILSISAIVLLTTLCLIFLILRLSNKTININPEKQPDLWSFYKGSGWSIVEDEKSWNKVLKITNSGYPVILKFGNEWINYKFSFETKVPLEVKPQHRNFTFVVRAKDKTNNVFIQCLPSGKIRPHLFANGVIVVDDVNEIDFLAEYPLDKWFPVSVLVQGDKVSISMMSVSATYKIPSELFAVSSGMVSPVMLLSKVMELNLKKKSDTPEGGVQVPVYVLDLDYEKGTVGFREYGEEMAMFRKIKVELIQPLYR